jgi:hypothetical protein
MLLALTIGNEPCRVRRALKKNNGLIFSGPVSEIFRERGDKRIA